MPLQTPSGIKSHDASIEAFCKLFNKVEPLDMKMEVNESESYTGDGWIYYEDRQIHLDWERRRASWISGPFPWLKTHMYLRKFKEKKGIDLHIQSSLDGDYFFDVWMEDFPLEVFTKWNLNDRGKVKEYIRKTDNFRCHPLTADGIRFLKVSLKDNQKEKLHPEHKGLPVSESSL